ncbi:nineteen complex-related protein 2-domain-containing protein [Linnemannia elongata]|nr:nineteen complex-related protein 2-domain-containing protein [Linnemannia elongata]
MFTPKKNRNIRKKVNIDDGDETPAQDSGNNTPVPDNDTAEAAVKVKKVKKKIASTVLSFGDDEQESEDTFKIKKSSASRRLANNKGKETSDATDQQQHQSITSRATVGNAVSYSKEALDELRKSTQSTAPNSRLHDSNGSSVEEKFPSLLGGPTIIPDAAAIHLAKKKREQMRLRNDHEEEEFISLAGGDDDRMIEERNTRMVREEDDEMDDGEADLEKVLGDKLALGQRAQRQAEKSRRAARKEMIEDIDADEEDEEETREWEMQQIRNAGVINRETGKKNAAVPVHRTISIPTVTQVPNIAEVKKRLQDRLSSLKNQLSEHQAQLKHVHLEEAEINIRTVESGEAMSKASARYTFFQELRSYCRNLAAFFEEKYPDLEAIEKEFRTMLSERTLLVLERRRLDLRDDLVEFANVVDDENKSNVKQPIAQEVDEFGRSIGVDPLAAQKRRKAERERRKAQRKQLHAADGKDVETYDGLSTDDELGSGDARELGDAVMELEDRRLNLFKEVGPEFNSLEAVKRHFQAWKAEYPSDYNKAYGGLLLPLVFDLFVRQEICLWNPIRVKQDISEQSWHQAVTTYPIARSSRMYDHSDSDSDHQDDEEDMDKDLLKKVVAKSLCPKITQFLSAGGVDLYSAKQSNCLVAIMEELLDYVENSNSRMEQLIKALLQTILNTAEAHRLQFIQAAQPLTPRPILTAHGVEARERYLWKTIGLFRNLMLLRKFVPADTIDRPVVDGLLHDCILRLLEGDDKNTVAKYQMIFHALPKDIRSQERHTIIDRMAQSL